jgi:hypothetical protein
VIVPSGHAIIQIVFGRFDLQEVENATGAILPWVNFEGGQLPLTGAFMPQPTGDLRQWLVNPA